jgi:hypothetical protein
MAVPVPINPGYTGHRLHTQCRVAARPRGTDGFRSAGGAATNRDRSCVRNLDHERRRILHPGRVRLRPGERLLGLERVAHDRAAQSSSQEDAETLSPTCWQVCGKTRDKPPRQRMGASEVPWPGVGPGM